MPIVVKSGSLNLLEPSGPVQDCNGIAKNTSWRGLRWHGLWRHFATCRKVAGSIPDSVIGFFRWHNPSGRTMAPGLTQPLTEMSTTNISWGVKAAFMCWLSWNQGASTSWNPQGLSRPVMGLLYFVILPGTYFWNIKTGIIRILISGSKNGLLTKLLLTHKTMTYVSVNAILMCAGLPAVRHTSSHRTHAHTRTKCYAAASPHWLLHF